MLFNVCLLPFIFSLPVTRSSRTSIEASMAEALGVVASGVAVAQLASQVASSIVKLKTFWEQVKDVPTEIRYLLFEIDSWNLILSRIQQDLERPSNSPLASDTFYLAQSLDLCRQGSDALKVLVIELAAKVERKSGLKQTLGSAKVALKSEDLKRLKRRMKSAVRLLSLSLQCYTR